MTIRDDLRATTCLKFLEFLKKMKKSVATIQCSHIYVIYFSYDVSYEQPKIYSKTKTSNKLFVNVNIDIHCSRSNGIIMDFKTRARVGFCEEKNTYTYYY